MGNLHIQYELILNGEQSLFKQYTSDAYDNYKFYHNQPFNRSELFDIEDRNEFYDKFFSLMNGPITTIGVGNKGGYITFYARGLNNQLTMSEGIEVMNSNIRLAFNNYKGTLQC